jgi:hypothetical protein
VSCDIYVRAFADGAVVDRDGLAVRRLLLKACGFRVEADGRLQVAGAEVYGLPVAGRPFAGLLFSRSSVAAFDLIVAVAQAGGMVILPVGCAACIVAEGQRAHLPGDIAGDGVELVESGAALAAVVERALPSSP